MKEATKQRSTLVIPGQLGAIAILLISLFLGNASYAESMIIYFLALIYFRFRV